MKIKIPDIVIPEFVFNPPDSRTITPDKNSMLHWFPKIAEIPFDILPKTEMVRFDDRTLWPFVDGLAIPNFDISPFIDAANKVGYPCFLRGDESSAKHDGPNSYKIDSADQILERIKHTFYDNICKDLKVLAFVFREWINIDAAFYSFGYNKYNHGKKEIRRHPIGPEFRFFVDSETYWCSHFYWPLKAFNDIEESINHEDLSQHLRSLRNSMSSREFFKLKAYAILAAKKVNEDPLQRWSVDFAKDVNDKWWLIDMALAESSYHEDHNER